MKCFLKATHYVYVENKNCLIKCYFYSVGFYMFMEKRMSKFVFRAFLSLKNPLWKIIYKL